MILCPAIYDLMKIKNLYGMVPGNMGFSIENTCVHSFLSPNLFRAILFSLTSNIEQESKVIWKGVHILLESL